MVNLKDSADTGIFIINHHYLKSFVVNYHSFMVFKNSTINSCLLLVSTDFTINYFKNYLMENFIILNYSTKKHFIVNCSTKTEFIVRVMSIIAMNFIDFDWLDLYFAIFIFVINHFNLEYFIKIKNFTDFTD